MALKQRLLDLSFKKQSVLCVAVDVELSMDLLAIADAIGPFICVLKTHVDMLKDFSLTVSQKLSDLAKKHDFLLFEDRKLAAIGPVVASQYSADGYHISEWAHLVTVHGFPGHRLLDSIASAITKNQDRGILMITDMSSSTAIPGYAERCFQLAQQYKHLVVGLIAQKRFPDDHHFLYLTPGVSLEATGDSLGQRYRTPLQALMNDGCDFVIVGRSITRHYHPLNISGVIESARHYQQVSWAVHLQKQSKLSPSAVVNPLRRQLNDLIAKKKSHLGISVQVSDSKKLLEMATQAGPFIVMLKTHSGMISDWTSETALKLKQLAQEHEFLIFEDRKFADIGNVVKEQYSKGRCKIADWAHIVSAHMIPGDGMIAGIKAGIPTDVTEARGIVLISQMMDSLDIAGYHEHSYAMAKRHSDMVLGFYGHQALEYDTQFVNIFDYQDKAATQKPKGHVYLVDETLVSSLFQTHELTSFLSKTLDKFRSLLM